MTLAKLKELVRKGELHYIQLGGGMGGGMGGNNTLSSQITTWVEKNGTAVKESAYDKSASSGSTSESGSASGAGSDSESGAQGGGQSASTLYRLDRSDVG